MNLLGGDNLTFYGTYFPYNLVESTFDLTFSDAQGTKCIPQESTTGEFVCLTEPFDEEVGKGEDLTITVIING